MPKKKDPYEGVQDVPRGTKVYKVFRAIANHAKQKLSGQDSEDLKRFHVVYCNRAEYDHRRDKRAYAHSFHFDNGGNYLICCSRRINSLEGPNIAGILLHELGHMLGGEHESEADTYIREVLGIVIEYDTEGIEYVDCEKYGLGRR